MEDALLRGARASGLELIETMVWDGSTLVREARHMARLRTSASRLGWACDIEAIRESLHTGREGPSRLRLSVDRVGAFRVIESELPAGPVCWRLKVSDLRIRSDDPWLGVKSTNRPVHDAARAALLPSRDEALLVNERGEVCEGTITTVFFDRGRGWRTPPLASGCLPGILRSELIERRLVAEEVLFAHELPDVRLALGNAVRGLVPAQLDT